MIREQRKKGRHFERLPGFTQDDSPLNNVLQFANISGPVVLSQKRQCTISKWRSRLSGPLRDSGQEELGQPGNILFSRAQRRYGNWKDIEAVVEILAKFMAL